MIETTMVRWQTRAKRLLQKHWLDWGVIIGSLAFSFWLMWLTFGYEKGAVVLSSKVWSDFGNHLPLIRSFSFGNNFPPEFPLFPGEPIRYHYLFYLFVGFLEKIGFRLDWALNLPSSLTFALLLTTIYFLAKTLFKSAWVGFLSVLFFLFNGSLSFLEFFKVNPLSADTIHQISQIRDFQSFGPYDNKVVSAFWNLNVYTNQRHLAAALSLLFILVMVLIKQETKEEPHEHRQSLRSKIKAVLKVSFWKQQAHTFFHPHLSLPWSIAWGLALGLTTYLNASVFLMGVLVLGVLFLLMPKQRLPILIIGALGVALSLPRTIFVSGTVTYSPMFHPGYLIFDRLSLWNFINYWFYNLGLLLVLLPIGLIFASRTALKVFLAFFALFIVGNLFQFTIEIAGNHKLFNAFVIVANMFAALAIVKIWTVVSLKKPKNAFLGTLTRGAALVLVFFMTFSGIIDFLAIYNDRTLTIDDFPKNQPVSWIVKNTMATDLFLNTQYLYDPASLAGRKVWMGWPYFAWSQGYDTLKRTIELKALFGSDDKDYVCDYLRANNLTFVEITEPSEDFPFDAQFWKKNFQKVYENQRYNIVIYNVARSCPV